MAQDSGSSGDGSHAIVVRPNDSLGTQGRIGLFLLVAAAVLAVPAAVAARGFWPILVFAGIELAGFGACLYWVHRLGLYREVILIEAERVRVEMGRGRPEREWRFSRDWVRVELDPPVHRNHKARLFLREGRAQCEIGRCLTESERTALGERLKGLLAA